MADSEAPTIFWFLWLFFSSFYFISFLLEHFHFGFKTQIANWHGYAAYQAAVARVSALLLARKAKETINVEPVREKKVRGSKKGKAVKGLD